ncbi:uridine kinase [Eremococcus coleocola]|uniref:Uridine kinase n=1 Tax=Eremococcus coleocola ACS-139-V-Col8 TaxID=908337 RepID=E4KP11_9LACT|nr:uridine kinase [Eremococcus coleocola]EFR31257.1 uridine kinase [Eremococcus coleocola ACS-139-V-Col8]
MAQPIVIGVTGGSGSGKSSVSRQIVENFSDLSVLLLQQDSYYRDQSDLSMEQRRQVNYDHPLAFDNDLFFQHLTTLIKGGGVEMPVYDFASFTRTGEFQFLESREVIIVEGILILDDVRLRNLMDIKVYVDTDDDIRLCRRILRDIKERGRSIDSVINQYVDVVKPMHHQFVEPQKRYADIIVPEGGYNQVAIDLLTTKVATILNHVNG